MILLYEASKSFMMAIKAFMKLSEAAQRSVKIKIKVSFYFNTAEMHGTGRVNIKLETKRRILSWNKKLWNLYRKQNDELSIPDAKAKEYTCF